MGLCLRQSSNEMGRRYTEEFIFNSIALAKSLTLIEPLLKKSENPRFIFRKEGIYGFLPKEIICLPSESADPSSESFLSALDLQKSF